MMTIPSTSLPRGYTYPSITRPSLRDISMDFGAHLPQSSRYYTLSHISEGSWVVTSGCSTTTTTTRRAAVQVIRAAVVRAKAALGRDAVRRQWESICAASAADARGRRGVAQLLAEPTARKLAYDAVRLGKSWTQDLDYYAVRSVQRAAIDLLRARHVRRADRATADAAARAPEAQPGTIGRILRLHRDRVAARERQRIATRDARIKSALGDAYRHCDFRRAGAGDHTLRLSVGAWVSVHSDTTRGDRYSSRCTWRKTDSLHSITVRADWCCKVKRNGLSMLDDPQGNSVLVIDAERIATGVWRVTYVRQGRGFSLETETGFAVRHGGGIRLGKTETAARKRCTVEFAEALS